jgi:hypothetical protein
MALPALGAKLSPIAAVISVTIPNSITSIGGGAFAYCTNRTSVIIPGSVTSIGDHAFWLYSGLTAFTVAESNIVYSAEDGILYNKAKTTIISVPGAKSGVLNNLPSTLTSIGDFAFYNCSGLINVTIPGGVTSFGSEAFSDCSALTSVTIPGSVTSIESYTFSRCSSLTSVTFGAGNNITTAWSDSTFNSNYNDSGNSLWAAYISGASKAGTYTLSGTTWMQIQ